MEWHLFSSLLEVTDAVAVPATDARSLRVTTERVGVGVVVHVGGDIDAANVAAWRNLLGEVATAAVAPGPLIVDIGELDFMAVCGFAALTATSDECRRRGIPVRIVGGQHLVRVIDVCRWHTELPVYPTADAASHDDRQRGDVGANRGLTSTRDPG